MPEVRPDAIRSPRGSAILPLEMLRPVAKNADLHGCPRLTLTLGRDRHSSAVSVTLRSVSGGMYPSVETLLAERWSSPVTDTLAAVRIAIQALQSIEGRLLNLQ